MHTIKSPLCKCNNCDTVYLDTNPQVNATQFNAPLNTPELTFQYEKNEGYFKGCPKCETDGFLIDVNGNENLTTKEQKLFKIAL